jgi:hypothetical protein
MTASVRSRSSRAIGAGSCRAMGTISDGRSSRRRDAEGIVAKWTKGTYHTDSATTSWLKIKNPSYSQAVGRYELFERQRSGRVSAPLRRLDPAAAATFERARA